ncbi:putative transcription factor interactor and regulator LIM family [Helianthus annuus]|nr:putative transcription factor interactor and regulator LIM family [Helianthus annuus]
MYFIKNILTVFPLLLSSIHYVEAQSAPPPDDYQYARFSPSMAIIIVVLVAALFCMGFFSIYIRRCSEDGGPSARGGLSMRRAARLAAASRGLDAGVLETFPTFAYSTVKGLKIGKGALECAVCLNEFEDEETIRLIPKCDHVFHAECIDAWLEQHVTCPVCRSNLVPKPGESTHGTNDSEPLPDENNNELTSVSEQNTDVSIRVGDAIPDPTTPVLNRVKSANPYRPPRSKSVRGPALFEKFRSHSTGHSLVQVGEDTERFTLRLPEDVRKQVIDKALLNRTGSTVRLPGEGSGRKGYRTGSTGSGSYRRMGSIDRSVFSRAPSFLSRAFSVRSQKGAGASANGGASTSTTSDKVPLNNIGPKSDEVFGRPPV